MSEAIDEILAAVQEHLPKGVYAEKVVNVTNEMQPPGSYRVQTGRRLGLLRPEKLRGATGKPTTNDALLVQYRHTSAHGCVPTGWTFCPYELLAAARDNDEATLKTEITRAIRHLPLEELAAARSQTTG